MRVIFKSAHDKISVLHEMNSLALPILPRNDEIVILKDRKYVVERIEFIFGNHEPEVYVLLG